MRNFLYGIIVGICIAVAGTVTADGVQSLIGKQIDGQFKVKVDGEELPVPAISVSGTSFLPVRSFGEHIGYDVLFNPEGEVILTKKEADQIEKIQADFNAQIRIMDENYQKIVEFKKTDAATIDNSTDYEMSLLESINGAKAEIEVLVTKAADMGVTLEFNPDDYIIPNPMSVPGEIEPVGEFQNTITNETEQLQLINEQIEKITAQIEKYTQQRDFYQEYIDNVVNNPKSTQDDIDYVLRSRQPMVDSYEQSIEDLNAELAELEKQKFELES